MNSIVVVQTDKPYYYAGEAVRGHIMICVGEPTMVSDICLQIKGEEFSFFIRRISVNGRGSIISSAGIQSIHSHHARFSSRHRMSTRTQTVVPCCENRVIFNVSTSLLHYGQPYHEGGPLAPHSQPNVLLQPATYRFPFSIQLPVNLPGSFGNDGMQFQKLCTQDSNKSIGSIQYHIKAMVAQVDGRGDVCKARVPLHVHEPLQRLLEPAELQKQGPISFLCCVSRGRTMLSLTYNKNAYAAGETVRLRLHIDHSAGKSDLKGVNVRLYKTLLLRADYKEESTEEIEAAARSGPVVAGVVEDRMIELLLPASASPSCHGALVECSYMLVASLDVPWSPDVVVKCPIQIYMPSLPPPAKLSAEQMAAPVEFPAIQIPVELSQPVES